MAPEANEGSAFGVLALTEEEPLDEGLAGEGTEPEAGTSTEPTQPPAGVDPGREQQPSQEPPGSEGEAAPQAPQYAGRFQSVEALEKGFREAEAWGTRTSQEAAELRRAVEAQQTQTDQMRQLLEALAPSILQQQVAENPELAERLRLIQSVQPLVEQQVAPYRQQFEEMQQRQQIDAEQVGLALRVGEWRQRSGVQPGTPEDVSLAGAVQALDLDISDAETGHLALDLALEASRDATLLNVLRANPHLIEIEGGVDFAKQQAAILKAQTPAPNGNGTAPPPGAGQQARAAAYVETGGQAAPTSGAPGGGKDEFDEAIAAWQREKGSPLFQ